MRIRIAAVIVCLGLSVAGLTACTTEQDTPAAVSPFTGDATTLIDLSREGQPAFGAFVPSPHTMFDANRLQFPTVDTAEAAAMLGRNELLDFVFLRLDEGNYDLSVVDAIAAGIASIDRADRPAFLVGIEKAAEAQMRQQVEAVLMHGVDGVVIPYIGSELDAVLAVSFFADIGAGVWSPDNPDGKIIAMLMIETADGLAAAERIINTGGYSALGCGVGSLASDLGDMASAEQACDAINGLANAAGLPGMMTGFNGDMLDLRLEQGYDWILTMLNEQTADIINSGRISAER